MTEQEMKEAARANIESNLEVDVEGMTEEEASEAMYDECYTLGFDRLHDLGVDDVTARRIAGEVAASMARP